MQIYTRGVSDATNKQIKVYSNDFDTLLWDYAPTIAVAGMAVDPLGNVVLGASGSSYTPLLKLDSTGALLWQPNVTLRLGGVGISICNDTTIVAAGSRVDSRTFKKVTTDGVAVWAKDGTDSAYCVATDLSNNIYIGCLGKLYKYDSAGNLIWTVPSLGDVVNGVACDLQGNVYIGQDRSSSLTTRKYTPDGTPVWAIDHGGNVEAIAVDNLGNVYTGGSIGANVHIRKYDTDSNLIWSAAHGATVISIAVDPDFNVYVGGSLVGTVSARKYDSSGTLLSSNSRNMRSRTLAGKLYGYLIERFDGGVWVELTSIPVC